MKDQEDFRKRKRLRPSKGRLSKAALDRLVEEANVDCYNEPEQATGHYTMIEENLKVPFETEVLGKRQRNAVYSFLQRIGSDGAVGSSVLPACVSLRNTLRWQSQEAARIYVAEASLLRPNFYLKAAVPCR